MNLNTEKFVCLGGCVKEHVYGDCHACECVWSWIFNVIAVIQIILSSDTKRENHKEVSSSATTSIGMSSSRKADNYVLCIYLVCQINIQGELVGVGRYGEVR